MKEHPEVGCITLHQTGNGFILWPRDAPVWQPQALLVLRLVPQVLEAERSVPQELPGPVPVSSVARIVPALPELRICRLVS